MKCEFYVIQTEHFLTFNISPILLVDILNSKMYLRYATVCLRDATVRWRNATVRLRHGTVRLRDATCV